MNTDQLFMKRCLQLAEGGIGQTEPNPYVGAVVVHNNQIVGEGFHRKLGGPHAEVFAIQAVSDKELLRKSTLFVNLEPCSHYGKTPPCAELIIKNQIPKVVVAITDPNPLVAGRGIEMLRTAGIEVVENVLSQEASWLNRRFITFHAKKRPYIILKWAQTRDGFIDIDRSDPNASVQDNWITGSELKTLVHQWRSQEMGILIGKNTLINDNPQLTVREWTGRNPIRILVTGTIPNEKYAIFGNDKKTLVFNPVKSIETEKATFIKIDFSDNIIQQVCNSLFDAGISSIIVEGGKQMLNSFISTGIWDEARVLTGEKTFQKGLEAPSLTDAIKIDQKNYGKDSLQIYINNRL